jgi:hypothetical protein
MKFKIVFILTIILTSVTIESCIRTYCQAVKDFKKDQSCGVVTKKYRVEWNRNEPRLRLKNYCNNTTGFKVTGDNSGLWDYVVTGDSIFKEKDSFIVFVYRKGIEDPKVFTMNFGCN